MKNTFQKISIAFLLLLVVSACQSQQSEHVKVVNKEVFAEAIKKEVQLVDVRTESEYKEGFIGQAQNIDINSNEFEEKISKLDKNKPVYIYCKSGARSQKAAQKMTELGFKEIIDLEGGYMNW
jgi:rhodanese-related sulfurtransferase